MAQNVAAADRHLGGAAAAEVDRQLAQAGAHPAAEPDGNGAERAAEMLAVEPLVRRREPLEQGDVARPRTLHRGLPLGGRVELHREPEELALGQAPHGAWEPRVEE